MGSSSRYAGSRRKPQPRRFFGVTTGVHAPPARDSGRLKLTTHGIDTIAGVDPFSSDHDLTTLLAAWRSGDDAAREALMRRVYANVRAIAAQSLRCMPGATLSATDLAHEALLRLLGSELDWHDRRHFFHVAAQATRQVLVDAARKRLADKRGGGAQHVELDEAVGIASVESDELLLRVDAALRDLAGQDARRARTVELVYFGGLSRPEVAAALDVSEGTIDRDLRLARAWLKTTLEGES